MSLPAMSSAAGEQLHGNRESRDKKNDGAEDPHEGSGGSLIGERADAEHAGLGTVAGVNEAPGENEKRRDAGVDHISGK